MRPGVDGEYQIHKAILAQNTVVFELPAQIQQSINENNLLSEPCDIQATFKTLYIKIQ